MAVIDWTRTSWRIACRLAARRCVSMPSVYAAFDCYILERAEAEADYPTTWLNRGPAMVARASEADKERLLATSWPACPALRSLRRSRATPMLARYQRIGREELRANYARFLREVVQRPKSAGQPLRYSGRIRGDLFGLPRIVSSATICNSSSTLVRPQRTASLLDGAAWVRVRPEPMCLTCARLAPNIHFVHLPMFTRNRTVPLGAAHPAAISTWSR